MAGYRCPVCDVCWTVNRLAKGVNPGGLPHRICPDCVKVREERRNK